MVGRPDPSSLLSSFLAQGTSSNNLISMFSNRHLDASQMSDTNEVSPNVSRDVPTGTADNAGIDIDILEEELSTLRECTRSALLKVSSGGMK